MKSLLLPSLLNLLFMHYYFYMNGYLEWTLRYSEFVNACAVVFDVAMLFILFAVLLRGRAKGAAAFVFALTLVWSFVNVVYARFFFQYLSLSAIGEAGNLGDGLVIDSVMAGFHWYDLYYIIVAVAFVILYQRCPRTTIVMRRIPRLLWVPVGSLMLTIAAYSAYHFAVPKYRGNWELYGFRLKEFMYDAMSGGTPNLAHFQTGSLRVAAQELYDLMTDTELTDEERNEIAVFYKDHSQRDTRHERPTEIRNVVFILLESFLSSVIDTTVCGKEVTPFLNSLVHDSAVYYNGRMRSDIGCGESGDGQFIYMNGILPLRNKMTVGQVKHNTLPSLPRLLKRHLGIKHTEIILPTRPNLWQQADMNVAYDIDSCFAQMEIAGDLSTSITDEQLFDYAVRHIDTRNEPFFSLLLSVSTHSPYNKYEGENLFAQATELPETYRNYLNTCHYTDMQLRSYFDSLKATGLYDRTLIVIAADHYAHLDALGMTDVIDDCTPLFIIHGGFDPSTVWHGEMHQLDLYTTLLDLLAIPGTWRGLGHTLLTTQYENSVTDKAHHVSELIVEGDYFNTPPNS